jgi:predicted phosphate transport protein (TIGR00153 family)
MLRWLLPKETRLFSLVDEQMKNLQEACRLLLDLLHKYENVETKTARIHELEHAGDNLTHIVKHTLDSTFVTPIDREDIHALTSAIDKILDYIDAAAKRMLIFRLKSPTPEMIQIAECLQLCVTELHTVVPRLGEATISAEIRTRLTEIVRLEKDADLLHHRALARLFEEDADPIHVVKVKEIIGYLESAVDCCEDVAYVVEGVVIKYS